MRLRALACVFTILATQAAPATGRQRVLESTSQAQVTEQEEPGGYPRAWQNYDAIVTGQRRLSDLSTIELEELILLDREVRAQQPDRRSPREKCFDAELSRLGSTPSRLALRTIDLKCSQR